MRVPIELNFGDRAQTFLLRPCRVCVAPIVDPMPADWTFDLTKEGPASGPAHSFITPHRPGCTAPEPRPQPGLSVRVPGSVLTLEPDGRAPDPHPFTPFSFHSPHVPGSADWCAHGAVAHMMAGRGFCGRTEDHPLHLPVRLVRRGETFPHIEVRRENGEISTRVPIGARIEPQGLPADGSLVDLDVIVYRGDGKTMVITQIGMIAGDSLTVRPGP